MTEDDRQEPQLESPTYESISSGEDDAYENAGTDQDCSERSGSATDKDTPTRLALERRKEAKKKSRAKITSRRLESPKASIRTVPYAPKTHLSSSVGRSSPCAGRTPAVVRRRSPSTGGSSPSVGPRSPVPSNAQLPSTEKSPSPGETGTGCPAGAGVGRKNLVTGLERQLLDVARELVLDYTLFRHPFPSAPDLTAVIHQAWVDSQEWHEFSIEPSEESLTNVSTKKTMNVHQGILNVI